MHSRLKLALGAVALAGGTALLTAAALRPQEGEGMPDMDPAMIAKMEELATPGEEHQHLAKMAGTWEQHYRIRWSPDAEWMETSGTSEAEPVLDGRYIMEHVEFEMMGMPIKGMHMLGYDKMKGEYISLWADSMSTWWVTARGGENADGAVEMKGTMVDIAGERPFRMVIKHQSADAYEFEMYDTIPPHGEVLVMTSKAKRTN